MVTAAEGGGGSEGALSAGLPGAVRVGPRVPTVPKHLMQYESTRRSFSCDQ